MWFKFNLKIAIYVFIILINKLKQYAYRTRKKRFQKNSFFTIISFLA